MPQHNIKGPKNLLHTESHNSVSAVVASNNDNLFKLIASEPSHINQINSATPDFNTVMKNYGTFKNDTYKATLDAEVTKVGPSGLNATEVSRINAFTSLDDKVQTMQTDWDPETKLNRELASEGAKIQSMDDSRALLVSDLHSPEGVPSIQKLVGQEYQPIAAENPGLVLNEDTALQTTPSGQVLDAIGREVGQTWTNVGQESYVGLNTDELAFEAINAIKNEEKAAVKTAEYIDPHKYNRDGKDQIITHTLPHNQLHNEVDIPVVDHSITGTNQTVLAEQLAVESALKDIEKEAEAKAKSIKDENARQNALIDEIARVSDDQAYVDNSRRMAAELQKQQKLKEGKIEAEKVAGEIMAEIEQDAKNAIEILNAEEREKAESAASAAELLGLDITPQILEGPLVTEAQIDLEEQLQELKSDLPYVPYEEKPPTTLEPWGGTYEDNIAKQTVYGPREQELAAEEQAKKDKILEELQAERDAAELLEAQTRFWSNGENDGAAELARQQELAAGEDAFVEVGAEIVEAEETLKEVAEERKSSQSQTRSELFKKRKLKEKLAEEKAAALALEKQQAQEFEAKIRAGLKKDDERKEKASEQRASHDKFQNDRIENIANESDKKAHLAKKLAQLESNKQKILQRNQPPQSAQQISHAEAGKQWRNEEGFLTGNDPFRFSTFAYPRDVTTNMENGHYILFYVNVQNKTKYSYDGINAAGDIVPVGDQIMIEERKQRPTGKFSKKVDRYGHEKEIIKEWIDTRWEKGASKVFDTNIDYQKRRVLAGSKGNILRGNQAHLMKGRKSYQGLDSVMKTTTRITDSVALYLPPGVSDNTSVVYSGAELGMAGFLAFSFGEVVNKWKAHDFEGVADTLLDVGGTAFTETIKTLGLGAFGMMTGGEDVVGTFDKAFGQTLNPYIEVNFNSMGMRSFNYTFKFSPKSKQETQDVQDIIQLFRFHMAPELKGTNHRYLTLPSTFDIHYMYQSSPEDAVENQFYNKIATCVLNGCDVDYTPNGVKSFADGAPTQINMTLSFQETKMLTKQKINDGF